MKKHKQINQNKRTIQIIRSVATKIKIPLGIRLLIGFIYFDCLVHFEILINVGTAVSENIVPAFIVGL